jgi:hypothetical protein
MTNDKQNQYEAELIKSIESYRWMRWAHITWSSLSFSRATAYNHDLDKLDTIKNAFEENRNKGVNYLLQKWISSENATLQIAAMRIIAEEEDRKRLNQAYVDHTSRSEKLIFKPIDLDVPANDSIKEDIQTE